VAWKCATNAAKNRSSSSSRSTLASSSGSSSSSGGDVRVPQRRLIVPSPQHPPPRPSQHRRSISPETLESEHLQHPKRPNPVEAVPRPFRGEVATRAPRSPRRRAGTTSRSSGSASRACDGRDHPRHLQPRAAGRRPDRGPHPGERHPRSERSAAELSGRLDRLPGAGLVGGDPQLERRADLRTRPSAACSRGHDLDDDQTLDAAVARARVVEALSRRVRAYLFAQLRRPFHCPRRRGSTPGPPPPSPSRRRPW
jgi:hypothetical protein